MTRVERWERNAEIPLLLLALAFLAAYALLVVDRGLTPCPPGARDGFVGRLGFFRNRLCRAAVPHWGATALRAPALVRRGSSCVPVLRPLRLLRLFALARILNRSAAGSLVGEVTTYAAGVAVMSVSLGSLAILDVEQDTPHANITTFGDALWWSATTVTTVGYGDRYPVTTQGRLIAVVLIVAGIGLVGAVTASVAAWMVRQVEIRGDAQR